MAKYIICKLKKGISLSIYIYILDKELYTQYEKELLQISKKQASKKVFMEEEIQMAKKDMKRLNLTSYEENAN